MKECVILAGGFGERLQSVVKNIPKCMAEVGGKPFLSYLLNYLADERFEHVILALGYKSEIVIHWLSKNTFPFAISYTVEPKSLGTGGALKYAFEKANSDTPFVMNGDTLFTIDTDKFRCFHETKQNDISLALKKMSNIDRYSSVSIDYNQQITKFEEKKQCDEGLINGGVYLMNRTIFKDIASDSFSLEKDIFEQHPSIFKIGGFVQNTYFIDIGIPNDYNQANIDLKGR